MANNDDGDAMLLPRIPEPLSFDGRQVRKPVHRRTIDPTASINRSFETRLYRTRRPRSWFTRPNSHFVIDMLTPADCYDAPVSSIAMKFIRASVLQPPRPVNVVKWSPDGRRLISGSTKGTFSYWFGTTFNFESTLQAHEDPVRALQWSHNGTWLISADGGGEIKYWEYNFNNLTVFRGHNTTVRGLSFAPTDLKFASCSDDQKIKIWDFHQSREERVITGHTNMVRCVDWHPYKGLIASGSADNKVKLWDPRAPEVLNTLHGSKNDVTNLQWNRNGHWLCVTSRDTIVKLYDMRTMKEMQSFRGHKKGVTTVSWHPCQERLFATGGYDGSLIYWLVGQQTPVAATRTDSMGEMWSMDWHPVGHLLATGSSDNATRFWSRYRPDSAMVGGSGADKEDELAAAPGRFSQGTGRGRPLPHPVVHPRVWEVSQA
ncbi:pre-mRNA cleavage and polyadenylation factor (CPF) complex subunit [Dimargaris xerosporica]|nr:pre-mRNA cleavage and polyadenylation factor (CPF) complex subunit [Dimargaris xerosporica]